MRSKLTEARAEQAERLVAEGLTLDAVAARLGVHRRTILRWVERDPGFRARYARARRAAHEGLYRELREAVAHAGGSRPAAHAARRRLMRRAPKKHASEPRPAGGGGGGSTARPVESRASATRLPLSRKPSLP